MPTLDEYIASLSQDQQERITVEKVILEMQLIAHGKPLREREMLCSEFRKAALDLIDLTPEERESLGLKKKKGKDSGKTEEAQ